MKHKVLIWALMAAAAGCAGKPTRFAVQNDSGEEVSNVVVFKGDKPTYLGSIAPGQRKEIKFNSYFETTYTLSYKKGSHDFRMDLCYQGMDYPADGLVIIGQTKPTIECR